MQNGKIVLIEVAPGIDADRDIIAKMDFEPEKSPKLKSIPPEIFQPIWRGLKKILEAKTKTALPEAA